MWVINISKFTGKCSFKQRDQQTTLHQCWCSVISGSWFFRAFWSITWSICIHWRISISITTIAASTTGINKTISLLLLIINGGLYLNLSLCIFSKSILPKWWTKRYLFICTNIYLQNMSCGGTGMRSVTARDILSDMDSTSTTTVCNIRGVNSSSMLQQNLEVCFLIV